MFIYSYWDKFCKNLKDNNIYSVTASYLLENNNLNKFIVLKHDVETNPNKALKLAKIEHKYSQKGSYYVQAYLLKNKKNIKILQKIKELGHEVTYHHDVMDSNQGDIQKAIIEFEQNKKLFEYYGFDISTVCQHGNPIVKREGYFSNRDFFRNSLVSEKYPHIVEIMVNYKQKLGKSYEYISDAGYGWKIIYDPENNDQIDSSDKDILIDSLNTISKMIESDKSIIISVHPHRWNRFYFYSYIKNVFFRYIKCIVKYLLKFSIFKKYLEKYYYLAKKI